MKKFFGILIMLMMIASNSFAMTFSQPVKIGSIGCMNLGGFSFNGVTANNGIRACW
ncbi:MAG: hypothetical protein IJK81_00215 [Selenomonadaceae bacterium]|nr:hypothetical protein [Selenomonadaceae bacterium]